ncbi:HAUS augmin-like complex subunit 5 [Amphiura filiformis]|uniref:HAUS augmin-like complex subunit 5 n=1 Tax=Amphiura filiformis TaxID=82378 RepID=UPI003B213FB7
MMSGGDEMSQRLHHWAVNEMHFTPCGRHVNSDMPTTDELAMVCRGKLLDIWDYVTTHVHSAQRVHNVKSNLLLNNARAAYRVKYKGDRKYSQQRAEKLEKKRALIAQLATAKTDMQHLSREVERMQTDIGDKEAEYQENCSKLVDLQRKSALLEAHTAECKVDIARYEEYSKRLADRLNQYQQPQISSTHQTIYFSKHGKGSLDDDEETGLETACTKLTRETCEDIEGLLQDMVLGEDKTDEKTMQQRRNTIAGKLEKIMTSNTAEQLLHSVAQTTEGAHYMLQQKTANIDLKKDAEMLRFKYGDGGQLFDTSTSSPNLMKSVHQLITEKQLAHIQNFTETERHLNQACRLDKRLEQLAGDVNNRLAIIYAKNPGALELARKLFSNELELAANTAMVKCLHEFKLEYETTASKATKEKEILYNKYQKIQDFKKLADQKQNIIRVLVRQNSEAKRKLDEQQKQLLRYMQTTLCGHEAGTVAMTTQLRNGVINEVEKFAGLPLQLMRLTELDSGQYVPIFQLSINRCTDKSAFSGGGAFCDILNHLNFPLYKAPENLLSHVMDMKCQISRIELQLNAQQVLYEEMTGIHTEDSTTIQHIAALVAEVAAHDKKQLSRLFPLLQSRQAEATQGLQDCIRVKDELTAWWEQPAQQLTPWVRLDNKSLQQWLDQWTVAVTRLRQLNK